MKILNVKTNCINSNYSPLKDYTFLSLWNKHLFQLLLIFTALISVAQECSNSHNSLLLTQQLKHSSVEKMVCHMAVEEIPCLVLSQRLITIFTTACHWTLQWPTLNHWMFPNIIHSLEPTSILSSNLCLGLWNGLFSSGFLTNI